MNLDITYCSKTNCKNKDCERNQNNLRIDAEKYVWIVANHPISIAEFKKCEHWEE